MSNELEGLSAELKKAAKTTVEVSGILLPPFEFGVDGVVVIERSKIKWLPAVLVAKEILRIKRVVDEMKMWHGAECRHGFPCSTCHVLKKVEEAFR